MATVLVGPGIRRCLSGIRNGNSSMQVVRAELSGLAIERKWEEKNTSLVLSFPSLLNSYSQSASPKTRKKKKKTQAELNEEVEQLLSVVTLKVRSSDETVLESYTQFMRRAATVLSLDVSGKVVIPMHVEKRTVLASPHIYAKHKRQYELRTHTHMLQVRELTGDSADIFLEYIQRNIPEGVSMSVEQTALEPLPDYIKEILEGE